MPFYDSIENASQLLQILKNNESLVILRFTATWCGPCKRIEPVVQGWLQSMPATVNFYTLDVDKNPEIYSFLKSKKRVNGIPAILCYTHGNYSYIPDEFVIDGDVDRVNRFFYKCSAMV